VFYWRRAAAGDKFNSSSAWYPCVAVGPAVVGSFAQLAWRASRSRPQRRLLLSWSPDRSIGRRWEHLF